MAKMEGDRYLGDAARELLNSMRLKLDLAMCHLHRLESGG